QARLLGSLFAGGHNYKVWASVSQRFYWSFHQGLLPVYGLTALAVAITQCQSAQVGKLAHADGSPKYT
ncbi:hypothetical protein, partial [Nostoc sp. ChiSLP03a]|uniref:hypothetical protein n=1 Tax=Nostoc sp. ChiSLP03a TaxID=3075380 RepID=UPI002AD4BC92